MSADEGCRSCGETYQLRNGSDDTGYCDPCAQEMVADALRYRKARRALGWLQGHIYNTTREDLWDYASRAISGLRKRALP